MPFWNPDRIQQLKDLCAAIPRPSASHMANLLETSRSAVISKVKRLKLALNPPQVHSPKPRPSSSTPKDYPITPTACTIFELTRDTCRWPLGPESQPAEFFCGAQPLPDLPYCEQHARESYWSYRAKHPE